MSGGTGGGARRLTDCYPGAKRSMIYIKDYIIYLFASFCESIILIRVYIVCSFADNSGDNTEASTRDIRARNARVSIEGRPRLEVDIIGSLSQVSSLLRTGVSVG